MDTLVGVVRRTGLGIPTFIALLFVIITALWGIYRNYESIINPVVVDFEITIVEQKEDYTKIWGTMNKRRDCEFKNLVAYDGTRLLDVDFLKDGRTTSRLPKFQLFGPWMIKPRIDHMEIFTRHECDTGSVISKIYSNSLGLENEHIKHRY